MPVFNAQDTLEECLDSIFRQSLQDFEIIAVDDFSTDDSAAILKSCNDPRIRLLANKNKGIVAALIQACPAAAQITLPVWMLMM